MQSKFFIIPILVMAFATVIVAPPAHAELVTLTAILAAVFASAIVTTEVIKSEPDTKMASKPDETDSMQQASIESANLEPAP